MESSSMDQKPKKTPKTTELPHRFIFDAVLPKLPVKSLLRLKCVAREWRSVISSVEFAKTHLQKQSSISSKYVLTLENNDSENEFFEALDYGDINKASVYRNCRFNKTFDGFYDSLNASCNGLAFLVYFPNEESYNFSYVVHNPLLGPHNLVEIPHPPELRLGREDFSENDFFFGFGYASNTKDYYIVAINLPGGSEIDVHVYSFNSGQWETYSGTFVVKEKAVSLLFSCYFYAKAGTLINQTLHWGMSQDDDNQYIFAFDLAKPEEAKLIECPPFRLGERESAEYEGYFRLCCLDDCLCAWAVYGENELVEMWMMKDYGKSWTKLFRFETEDYICCNFFGHTNTGQVLFLTAEDKLIPADFTRDPPMLFDAVLEKKTTVVNYIPSLVSVLHITPGA